MMITIYNNEEMQHVKIPEADSHLKTFKFTTIHGAARVVHVSRTCTRGHET
jgi:hypothetical protein